MKNDRLYTATVVACDVEGNLTRPIREHLKRSGLCVLVLLDKELRP